MAGLVLIPKKKFDMEKQSDFDINQLAKSFPEGLLDNLPDLNFDQPADLGKAGLAKNASAPQQGKLSEMKQFARQQAGSLMAGDLQPASGLTSSGASVSKSDQQRDASRFNLDSLAAQIDNIPDSLPWNPAEELPATNTTQEKAVENHAVKPPAVSQKVVAKETVAKKETTPPKASTPQDPIQKKSVPKKSVPKKSLWRFGKTKSTDANLNKPADQAVDQALAQTANRVESQNRFSGSPSTNPDSFLTDTSSLPHTSSIGHTPLTASPQTANTAASSLTNSVGQSLTNFEAPVASASNPAVEEIRQTYQKKSEGVPFLAFLVILSYASVVTIACVYFMLQVLNGKSKDLESLPDVKPMLQEGAIVYPLISEARSLAAGHSMNLGTSRRFGNILVTPVGVSMGDLSHNNTSKVSFTDTKQATKKPVLKLWLRFKNVSEDQAFAPLGHALLLARQQDKNNPEWIRSNNFVCKSSQKAIPQSQVLLNRFLTESEWNSRKQTFEKVLQPGESLDVYLPTAEIQEDQVSGRMVWRVHFRKGYHPETKNSVTTLIEVYFNKTDIQIDRV